MYSEQCQLLTRIYNTVKSEEEEEAEDDDEQAEKENGTLTCLDCIRWQRRSLRSTQSRRRTS